MQSMRGWILTTQSGAHCSLTRPGSQKQDTTLGYGPPVPLIGMWELNVDPLVTPCFISFLSHMMSVLKVQ